MNKIDFKVANKIFDYQKLTEGSKTGLEISHWIFEFEFCVVPKLLETFHGQ